MSYRTCTSQKSVVCPFEASPDRVNAVLSYSAKRIGQPVTVERSVTAGRAVSALLFSGFACCVRFGGFYCRCFSLCRRLAHSRTVWRWVYHSRLTGLCVLPWCVCPWRLRYSSSPTRAVQCKETGWHGLQCLFLFSFRFISTLVFVTCLPRGCFVWLVLFSEVCTQSKVFDIEVFVLRNRYYVIKFTAGRLS